MSFLQSQEVIDHTLSLFLELASGLVLPSQVYFYTGVFNSFHYFILLNLCTLLNIIFLFDYYIPLGRYMTGKLLLKLDTIKFIVANHTVIPFLTLFNFFYYA